MTEGPLLWYINRSTGIVVLVLLTLTTVLGVLAIGGKPARGVPRFVTQSVHRNIALLSVVLLVVHIVSAVADEFVDIRWWQAIVPFGASYEPLWLGLGAAALDLMVVVIVTSLLRTRMGHRTWRALHLTAYALWGLSIAHGIGMGTDLSGSMWLVTVACLATVPIVAALRLGRLLIDRIPNDSGKALR